MQNSKHHIATLQCSITGRIERVLVDCPSLQLQQIKRFAKTDSDAVVIAETRYKKATYLKRQRAIRRERIKRETESIDAWVCQQLAHA